MKWLVTLSALLLLGACGVPNNEVIPFKDGILRATTPNEANDYCAARRLDVHIVGRAPAESGVLFRCS